MITSSRLRDMLVQSGALTPTEPTYRDDGASGLPWLDVPCLRLDALGAAIGAAAAKYPDDRTEREAALLRRTYRTVERAERVEKTPKRRHHGTDAW